MRPLQPMAAAATIKRTSRSTISNVFVRFALPCLAAIILLNLSPAALAGSGTLQIQDEKTTEQEPEKKSAVKKAIEKTQAAIERRREKILKGRVDETEERPDRPTFSNRPKKNAGGTQDVTFDDIKFEMEKTERFKREMLTDEIREMDGTRISLSGYIKPSRKTKLSKFVFVRDNQECCFGPGAALFDCVLVKMAKGKKSEYTVRPITIEGDFYVKEYRGPTGQIWAVYRMKNAVQK